MYYSITLYTVALRDALPQVQDTFQFYWHNLLSLVVTIYTASFNHRTVFCPQSFLNDYSNQSIISLYTIQTSAFLMIAYLSSQKLEPKFCMQPGLILFFKWLT